MITPEELSATRQYLFLSPAEIAEEIGQSGEEWERYEAGLSIIPMVLIESMLYRLARYRAEVAQACMDDMVLHDQHGVRRIILLWYRHREDMPGNVSTARWRIYQSVCAEHIATARYTLNPETVPFDPVSYADWCFQRQCADTTARRLEWARERAIQIYGCIFSPPVTSRINGISARHP